MKSKSEIRAEMLVRRRARTGREEASRLICERLKSLQEWKFATQVLFYVNVHSEVMTRSLLEETLDQRGSVVIPWCQGDLLELSRIERMSELAPGAYGILEPVPQVRQLSLRQVATTEIDLILVPGVAFDSCGGRLGYGKGYYDRLLSGMTSRSTCVALAFECQLIDEVPREDHDVLMDWIVTESRTLECRSMAGCRTGNAGKK